MLSLSQKLSQQQKLSPQQIQYQKLLQLNTLAMEQRIKTELELNPVLEEELELKQEQEKDDDEFQEEDQYEEDTEFELEDFMNDDEYFDTPNQKSRDQEEDNFQPIAPARESLSQHLLEQLYMLDLDDDMTLLGEEILGNLNKDGYLKSSLEQILDELQMFHDVEIPADEAEKLLHRIHHFDPPGIAARDLQECLLIQLHVSSFDPYYTFLAEKLLNEYFKEFTQKRYSALMDKLDLSEDTLRSVIDLIQRLNPKPGEGNIEDVTLNQITPDFVIEKSGDNYLITLNDRAMPSVTINKTYLEMLQDNKGKRSKNTEQKNTYKFLREKFESAKWFIACIQQRRETLMRVMRTILEKQYDFFEHGPKHLKPMIYKDIADEISMDISTISRVVNGKFVQSPQGIHELKYFFSEGLATDSGEEVSNKQIKIRIQEIIDDEKKSSPLSDDKIAEALKSEGIHIARRTVAKYREQLKIPVARLRKEL